MTGKILDDTMDCIDRTSVLPVIVIDDPERAPDTASALTAGGLPCGEITLRTPAALAAIKRIAEHHPEFLVGAGTVLTQEQVDAAFDAGARFIVTPGFDEAVVYRAMELGVPIVPGVATATEIQRVLRAGLSRAKLFPAGALGGVGVVQAFAGPFPDLRLLPSGGVSLANAEEYLREPNVFAISGSWMASRAMIRDGAFAEIEVASRAIAVLAERRSGP